jgi:taurine dioxygenase
MAEEPTYRTIEVTPVTVRVGAEVSGVDLREPMSEDVEAEVKEALLRHCVLFFRGQDLTGPQQLAFASRFGPLNRSDFAPEGAVGDDAILEWLEDSADDPPATDVWHTDRSMWPEPPHYAVLNCRETPPVGGDTLWLSLYAVYDALSPVMQEMIEGLMLDVRPSKQTMGELTPGMKRVLYSSESDRTGCPQPLVRVHPITGRRALFLCGYSMYGIVGMKPDEGMALIELFRKGLHDPGVQCRWRWQQHDLVIWDERCTNHRALSDHFPSHRLMRRCTAGSSRPISGREARVAAEAGRPLVGAPA